MSAKSGMTIQYSEMALVSNNWDAEAAWKNFEELKVSTTMSKLSMRETDLFIGFWHLAPNRLPHSLVSNDLVLITYR